VNSVASAPIPRFAALQHRNFLVLWVGLIVSNAGTWMQNVAQAWLILQLTNSPLWLGLLGLSFAIPVIVLSLIGGAIADRFHRVRLLFFTQTAMMLNAFALAAITWLGWIQPWHILVCSFLSATLLAFDNPSRQALVPDLVPPRDLLNALSLNAATYNGAALIGPALAGILLAPLGVGTLFFLNGVSFLAVIVALSFLRNVTSHSGEMPGSSLHASVMAVLGHTWKEQLLVVLLLLSALTAIFGRSYQALLPVFARDIWGSNELGYGALLSAAGAGAMLGAFGLAFIRTLNRQGAVMIGAGWVFSISLILFALSPSLILGMVLLLIAGISSTVFGTICATFLQLQSPPNLRGRMMSLYAITLIGLPSLGALGIGTIAEALGGVSGAPRAIFLGGLICLVVISVSMPFLWPKNVERDPARKFGVRDSALAQAGEPPE
jgi:MFS family permease